MARLETILLVGKHQCSFSWLIQTTYIKGREGEGEVRFPYTYSTIHQTIALLQYSIVQRPLMPIL